MEPIFQISTQHMHVVSGANPSRCFQTPCGNNVNKFQTFVWSKQKINQIFSCLLHGSEFMAHMFLTH